eukprot:TRINITY_DN14757_c0_g1_i1.p1 TRINITY_DN14757_c0_g1~~TRINITY_DN14757_c0_g1_i1.p1  ORF type:complete len:331 (-),score=41.40 TRINITY_DN14757_c0_g1_i1:317-1309(-)
MIEDMKSASNASSSVVSSLTEHDYIIGLSEASSSTSSSSVKRNPSPETTAAATASEHNNDGGDHDDGEDNAELSLGLSLSCNNPKQDEHCRRSVNLASNRNAGLPWQQVKGFEAPRSSSARLLTAEDLKHKCLVMQDNASSFNLPSALSMSSRFVAPPSSGTKRLHHDPDASDAGEVSKGQVVGWPPIGAYRSKTQAAQSRCALYVKVNMDGVPIGRKVDLNAHDSYEALTLALEDMFQRPTGVNGQSGASDNALQKCLVEPNRLRPLDDSSDFVLTYEDKEGDWMLVGDVPWRMFVSTVKRLRIMKTSDANGLGPKCPEKMDSQTNRVR